MLWQNIPQLLKNQWSAKKKQIREWVTILLLSPFQGLVAAFVGAQQMLNSKISSLQEDILEHKQHINKLKKEFNEAWKREYDSEVR